MTQPPSIDRMSRKDARLHREREDIRQFTKDTVHNDDDGLWFEPTYELGMGTTARVGTSLARRAISRSLGMGIPLVTSAALLALTLWGPPVTSQPYLVLAGGTVLAALAGWFLARRWCLRTWFDPRLKVTEQLDSEARFALEDANAAGRTNTMAHEIAADIAASYAGLQALLVRFDEAAYEIQRSKGYVASDLRARRDQDLEQIYAAVATIRAAARLARKLPSSPGVRFNDAKASPPKSATFPNDAEAQMRNALSRLEVAIR